MTSSPELVLFDAAERGDLSSVLVILGSSGLNVNARLPERSGCTALRAACKADHGAVMAALIDHGAKFEGELNVFQESLLHVAAQDGSLSAVRCLLGAGSPVDPRTSYSRTPLFAACEGGFLGVVEALVGGGAQVTVSDFSLCTPLHVAATAPVATFLLARGAALEARDIQGNTPLSYAARGGRCEVVEYLVSCGADVEVRGSRDERPLWLACQAGHANVVTLLLKQGASLPARISRVSHFVETPMQVAKRVGALDVVGVLQARENALSCEWRPWTHIHYPVTFRRAVEAVLVAWSWNREADCAWHPTSPFLCLSLELLFEIFIWLSADVLNQGYSVVHKKWLK